MQTRDFSIGKLIDRLYLTEFRHPRHFESSGPDLQEIDSSEKTRSTMPKILLLVSLLMLASCDRHYDRGPSGGDSGRAEFVSNGERIYFTGTSASGSSIVARGASGHMNMHMRVHGGGCVTCHGVEREGKRLWPKFWIKAPALTAEALFAGAHGDGHGDHANYDAQSLRRAITEGVDPAGKRLDSAMPLWSMSRPDLDDLVAYLQQSPGHD